MYLHSATFSPSKPGFDGKPPKYNDTAMNRSINREITQATVVRNTMKDPVSSKLQIKGPKQADALHFVETRILKKQIESFPEDLLENSRRNYLLVQNDKRKSLQDFQCNILVKLETILKEKMIANGDDFRKYRVGGHDGGTYEIFFRVEPKRFMSEAQLLTALRLAFGPEVIKSESIVKKIFNSFDFFLKDEMDWRCFLYLLIVVMQPLLTTEEMIKHAYALYSSVGILDMTCSEKVKLGEIKDFICAPILLSKRSFIMNEFDQAWRYLQDNDNTILQYTAKRAEQLRVQKGDFDPNVFPIPYQFLQKLMTSTSFNQLLQPATVFGKRDTRTWSSVLEEEYYHPLLLQRLKILRRELRNEDEANQFIARTDFRRKRFAYQIWLLYRRKRIFLRHILVAYELRCTVMIFGIYIDKWKKVCMELTSAITIQRVVRGFLARRRRKFIIRLQQKVLRLQKNTRQYFISKKVKQSKYRLNWAATTIQRLFRGRKARRMAATMIEAYFDTQKRLLQKAKEAWELSRLVRASMAIQMAVRRFLRRRRTMKRLAKQEMEREVEMEMKRALEEQRITEDVYKQEISKWYLKRKEEYDLTVLNEKQTAKEKKKIVDRQRKRIIEEKESKRRQREQQLQKLEDERIERWIKDWEIKIQEIGVKKRNQCKNCLVLPETPEEIDLKKDIQKRVKVHIKEVLRKADKQKIPMEIPEAFEIATQEIIEEEVQAAMAAAKEEMRQEALRIEREKEQQRLQQLQREKEEKDRKRIWAIFTLQKHVRALLARKRLRQRAYQRYERFFDIDYHEYYYQDRVTKQTTWIKPASLGSYELPMEEYWILIPGKSREGLPQPSLNYYYNPATWQQTWVRPYGTIPCDLCQQDFGKVYYNEGGYDQSYMVGTYYCLNCFHQTAQEWMQQFQIPAKEILFQEFNGGKTDAIYLDFPSLPVIDYYTYCLDVNPALKASEEEEAQMRLEEAVEARKGGSFLSTTSGEDGGKKICECCFKRSAEFECIECQLFYCDSCNRKEHKLAHRKNHQRVALPPPIPVETVPAKMRRGSSAYFPPLLKTSSSAYLQSLQDSHKDMDYDSEEEQDEFPDSQYSPIGNTGPSADLTTTKKKKSKKMKRKKAKEGDSYSDPTTAGKEKKKKRKAEKTISDGESDIDRSTTDWSESTATSAANTKKKKKKMKKIKTDGKLSETSESEFSQDKNKTKKKKTKKPKTKSKVDLESDSEIDSSPERLKLPPINQRPISIPANLLQIDGNDFDEPDNRYSKSAGGIPEERKKRAKKKKTDKSNNPISDSESSVNTDQAKREKKPKKVKKKKSDGESLEMSSPSKTAKKKKKTKNSKPSNDSGLSESESSFVSTDKKKKKKKKAKKGSGEDTATSMSEGEHLTVIPEKKEKKRKPKKTTFSEETDQND